MNESREVTAQQEAPGANADDSSELAPLAGGSSPISEDGGAAGGTGACVAQSATWSARVSSAASAAAACFERCRCAKAWMCLLCLVTFMLAPATLGVFMSSNFEEIPVVGYIVEDDIDAPANFSGDDDFWLTTPDDEYQCTRSVAASSTCNFGCLRNCWKTTQVCPRLTARAVTRSADVLFRAGVAVLRPLFSLVAQE